MNFSVQLEVVMLGIILLDVQAECLIHQVIHPREEGGTIVKVTIP